MAGLPPDGRYVTGGVPAEMRAGAEITDGVDVAKPTAEMIDDMDGAPTQLTRIRLPRPDHIPPGAPKFDGGREINSPVAMNGRGLSYDFPLFPDVQVRVQFSGNATADHLEQLTELLNVQCRKLREQDATRRALEAERSRNAPARRVKANHAPATGKRTKDSQAPTDGE